MLLILHLDDLPHRSSVPAILAQTIPFNCLQSAPVCFLCVAYLQSKLEFFCHYVQSGLSPFTRLAVLLVFVI